MLIKMQLNKLKNLIWLHARFIQIILKLYHLTVVGTTRLILEDI